MNLLISQASRQAVRFERTPPIVGSRLEIRAPYRWIATTDEKKPSSHEFKRFVESVLKILTVIRENSA